jgi:acetyltransferase-like isoleucine patch superfamily enzyme
MKIRHLSTLIGADRVARKPPRPDSLGLAAGWGTTARAAAPRHWARRHGRPFLALDNDVLRRLSLGIDDAQPLGAGTTPDRSGYDTRALSYREPLGQEDGWKNAELFAWTRDRLEPLCGLGVRKDIGAVEPVSQPLSDSDRPCILVVGQASGGASVAEGAVALLSAVASQRLTEASLLTRGAEALLCEYPRKPPTLAEAAVTTKASVPEPRPRSMDAKPMTLRPLRYTTQVAPPASRDALIMMPTSAETSGQKRKRRNLLELTCNSCRPFADAKPPTAWLPRPVFGRSRAGAFIAGLVRRADRALAGGGMISQGTNPIMTDTDRYPDDLLAAELQPHGIGLDAPHGLARGIAVRLETPAVLGNTRVLSSTSIGRFTCFRAGRIGSLERIGRFCSVGLEAVIGEGNYPLDWFSTHPFQFGEAPDFPDCPELMTLGREIERSIGVIRCAPLIGHDVWIGTRAIILHGVHVGNGAVIGAGSVVWDHIRPYEIVAGVPARHIRFRFSEAIIERLLALRWWDYTIDGMKHVSFDCIEAALDVLETRIANGTLRKWQPRSVLIRDGRLVEQP